jgi:hypothetical protein
MRPDLVRSTSVGPLVGFCVVASLLAAFAALAASAAGYGGSTLAITPPPGWPLYRASVSLVIWRAPKAEAFRQNLVLTRQPSSATATTFDAQQLQSLQKAVPGFELGSFQETVVCGGQPGHYFSYAGRVNGQRFITEHMTLIRGGYAWSAQYTRLASQPAIQAARRSLTTLCGSDVAPGVTLKSGAGMGTQPVRSPAPTVQPTTEYTQPPAGSVAPTVTPRVGPW